MADVVKQQQGSAEAEGDSVVARDDVPALAATVQTGEVPPVKEAAAEKSATAEPSSSGDGQSVSAGAAAAQQSAPAKPQAAGARRPTATKTLPSAKAGKQPAAVKAGGKNPSGEQVATPAKPSRAMKSAGVDESGSRKSEHGERKTPVTPCAAGSCDVNKGRSAGKTQGKRAQTAPDPVEKPAAVARRSLSVKDGSAASKKVEAAATSEPSAADVLAEALRHGTHVAKLAEALFDQLQDLHGLDSSWRSRLIEAARLHDIGFVAGKKGHHKVSMRRILEDTSLALSAEDRPLVALLARYNRKAWPSCKHSQFAALPRATRKALRRAAALLRVADGLDYTHQALVAGLTVTMKSRSVVLVLHGKADCAQEMDRAVRKGDLFAHVFGLQVECACQPD